MYIEAQENFKKPPSPPYQRPTGNSAIKDCFGPYTMGIFCNLAAIDPKLHQIQSLKAHQQVFANDVLRRQCTVCKSCGYHIVESIPWAIERVEIPKFSHITLLNSIFYY